MAEGIALLSMYNDDSSSDDDDPMDTTPTPPEQETLASPAPPTEFIDPQQPPPARPGVFGIVDYEHDENLNSPEAQVMQEQEEEEGEIVSMSTTSVVVETTMTTTTTVEVRVSEEHLEERNSPGDVHILAPSVEPNPAQLSGLPEHSEAEICTAMDFTRTEIEQAEVEEDVECVEIHREDPLSNFLPPPLSTKCPEELQEKINKFLAYKKAGKSFNADLRNRKDYRNPDFLQHAVRYQDIDQIGTCFSKDVFNPHGYDKTDFYDELDDSLREARKKGQKVDFVSTGTHSVPTAPLVKTGGQIQGLSTAAATVLQSASTALESTGSKHSRKSKWDKVDVDARNPSQSGGHDDRPAAVHLSSVNSGAGAGAGSGYSAFAQQKRREAEEKRSSDRKFEKRS